MIGYGYGSWILLWFLVLAMAFGVGFDLCSVESGKYVDSMAQVLLGSAGLGWVQARPRTSHGRGWGGCIPLTFSEKMSKSLKSYNKAKYFVHILPTIPLTIFHFITSMHIYILLYII